MKRLLLIAAAVLSVSGLHAADGLSVIQPVMTPADLGKSEFSACQSTEQTLCEDTAGSRADAPPVSPRGSYGVTKVESVVASHDFAHKKPTFFDALKRHFTAGDVGEQWSAFWDSVEARCDKSASYQKLVGQVSAKAREMENAIGDKALLKRLRPAWFALGAQIVQEKEKIGREFKNLKPFLSQKAMAGARMVAPLLRAGMWGVAAQQALDKKSWLAKKVEAIKNVHLRRIARLSPLALAAFLDYLMARATGQYAVADAVIAPVKKAKKLFSKSTNDSNTVKPGIERSSSLSFNESHPDDDAVPVEPVRQ